MKKNALKYIVDTLLFVDICSIAMLGFLLAVLIPEGKASRASKYFMGLHRHAWGDIHLYLSVLLLMLLAAHLWLNWAWIAPSSKKYFGDKWKTALMFICGAWIVVLAIAYIATKAASVG